MTAELMRGATHVRQIIADYLQLAVPASIAVGRQQWLLEDWELPLPVVYNSYDPLTAQNFPAIGSLVSRTSRWIRNDYGPMMEEKYDARYNVQVFLWVRTPLKADGVTWADPPYDAALRLRDDMMGVVRGCLLNTPSLKSNGKARLNEATLTEDYFDAIKSSDQNTRWLAGGSISFELDVAESAYNVPLGSADTISVEGVTLP